jgi:hypothetical protein
MYFSLPGAAETRAVRELPGFLLLIFVVRR